VRAAWAGPGRWAGSVDGRPFDAGVEHGDDGLVVRWRCLRFEFREDTGARHHASAEHEGHLKAPMPGHVLDVRVAAGDRVKAGAVLVVLEAMKMEHSMVAPWAGTVIEVPVKPGDRVEEGVELARLAPFDG
jgi:acetyl/propionyl-CoA carboxylase alpha subunit